MNPPTNWFKRFQRGFVGGFEALRARYVNVLRWALVNRPTVFYPVFALIVCSSIPGDRGYLSQQSPTQHVHIPARNASKPPTNPVESA